MTAAHPTILLVDGIAANRMFVKVCLNSHLYDFLEADTISQGFTYLHRQRLDLIILHLCLPGSEGLTFLQSCKAHPLHATVPVIVCMTQHDVPLLQQALTLGSHDYFIISQYDDTLPLLLPLKVKNAIHTQQRWTTLLTQNKLFTQEFHAAEQYQRSLLPQLDQLLGMRMAAYFLPHMGVSGDFFDVVPLTDQKTALLLADVSGHGLLPAMVATLLKPLFRQYIRATTSPQQTLQWLNKEFLALTNEASYLTIFTGIYDAEQGTLWYANAGHPPPLYHQQASKRIEFLKASGMPLGIFDDQEWYVEAQRLQVASGDRLCLLTDGILSALSPGQECFGFPGLEGLFRDTLGLPVTAAIQHMQEHLQAFTKHSFGDDVTLLLVDFDPQVSPSPRPLGPELLPDRHRLDRSHALPPSTMDAVWDITPEGGRITLTGHLTLPTHKTLYTLLQTAITQDIRHFRLDLAGITCVDSFGLGALVACLSLVRKHGGTLQFRRVPAHIHELMDVTRLARLFDMEA